MPLFISYSSVDRKFVDKLAEQLVARNVSVWLDKWEIQVGDSLITKIQDAITGASGLLVVLSKNSVKSEWCRKELNAALIRELEEKRVVVLPLLLEDCDIPTFLREKRYADFRTDPDEGLRVILEAVAKVTNEWRARVTEPGWYTDSAIDWGKVGSDHFLRVTMVEQAKDQPYSILSVAEIVAKGSAADWFESHVVAGTDDDARAEVIYALAEALEDDDEFNVRLKDQHQVTRQAAFKVAGHPFMMFAFVRWLGEDTGRDVLFRLGGQIGGMADRMREVRRRAPAPLGDVAQKAFSGAKVVSPKPTSKTPAPKPTKRKSSPTAKAAPVKKTAKKRK